MDDTPIVVLRPAGFGKPSPATAQPLISLGRMKVLTGCNIYCQQSVIQQRLRYGDSVGPNDRIRSTPFRRGFAERFEALPFFTRTHAESRRVSSALDWGRGVTLAEVLLEAIIAIESAMAMAKRDVVPLDFAAVDHTAGKTHLVWQSTSPELSRQAAKIALGGILDLAANIDQKFVRPGNAEVGDFDAALAQLIKQARRQSMTATSGLMKYAAYRQGVPVEVLGRSRLRLGHGAAQRRVVSSMTESTSVIAQKLCVDKQLANRLLAELHLPVPRQMIVESPKAAREAAERLGYPLVIKPIAAQGGTGVTSGLYASNELEAAYRKAKAAGPFVVVEEYVPGFDHRLLVIGGKFCAAIRREPATITGDGKSTVRELIDAVNAEPRRDGLIMYKVDYDPEVERCLARADLNLDSVVAAGTTVPLRLVANQALGAAPIDCTEIVHPDNREMAERTARAFGLDVAGIDFISEDISRSYREIGGRIIEVNAAPGLFMHMFPGEGKPRNLGTKILDLLYPDASNGRIPIICVAGDSGTGATARIIDRLLRCTGKRVGLSLREISFIDGKVEEVASDHARLPPFSLLLNRNVEMLVCTISLRSTAQAGLGVDRCSVSVILDRKKEGRSQHYHAGTSVLDRATSEAVVVGCGNRVALEQLTRENGKRVVYVGNRITEPLVKEHLDAGDTVIGDAWADTADCMVLVQGGREIARFPLSQSWRLLPSRRALRARQATKYAIAALVGLGMSPSHIANALRAMDVDIGAIEDCASSPS